MGLFGNLMVGGMPNIKMAPPLTTVELKLPTPFGGKSTDTDKDGSDKTSKDDIPDALQGETEDYLTYKNIVNKQVSAVNAQIRSVVTKHDGDISSITKDPDWIDVIQPAMNKLQERQVELAALRNTIVTDKTYWKENRTEQEKLGILDSYYTDDNGLRIMVDKSGSPIGFESVTGTQYDINYKPVTAPLVKGTDYSDYMTYNDFYTKRNLEGFNIVEGAGGIKKAEVNMMPYGKTYTPGDLDKHIESLLTSADGFTKIGGGTSDVASAMEAGGTIKYYLTKYGSVKENQDQIDAIVVSILTNGLKPNELYESKQEYWKYADKYKDPLSYEEWFKNKVMLTATGQRIYEEEGGTKQFLDISKGGGGGSDVTDRNIGYATSFALNLQEGHAKILTLMNDDEKVLFLTSTAKATKDYLANMENATGDEDTKIALTETYSKLMADELTKEKYPVIGTILNEGAKTVTYDGDMYAVSSELYTSIQNLGKGDPFPGEALNIKKEALLSSGMKSGMVIKITKDNYDLLSPYLTETIEGATKAVGGLTRTNLGTGTTTVKVGFDKSNIMTTSIVLDQDYKKDITITGANLGSASIPSYFGGYTVTFDDVKGNVFSGVPSTVDIGVVSKTEGVIAPLNTDIYFDNYDDYKAYKEKLAVILVSTGTSTNTSDAKKYLIKNYKDTDVSAADIIKDESIPVGSDLKHDASQGTTDTYYRVQNVYISSKNFAGGFFRKFNDIKISDVLGTSTGTYITYDVKNEADE